MTEQRLPSWIAGRPSRDAILGYLDSIDDIPIADQVAYLDSGGDRETLEWATAGAHPGLAAQLGWVTVSMHDDWSTIFAPG